MINNPVVIGYSIILFGILVGIFLSFMLGKISNKLNAAIEGFTAGLLIAYICFEMLPVSFNLWGLYKSVFGILAGVVFSAFIEKRIGKLIYKVSEKNYKKIYKSAIILSLGVILHNIPEGIALGSMLNYKFENGVKLAVLISIHCIPEICTIFLPIKKTNKNILTFFIYGIIISIPILMGIIIGSAITIFSIGFISLCLSFSCGVMLYVICGEAVPESKSVWPGRLTTIISCFGFISGILLIFKF